MEYIIVGIIVTACIGYLIYSFTRSKDGGNCSCCGKKCATDERRHDCPSRTETDPDRT